MPQNLTKKTIKTPKKIAKKAPKSLNKSFKTHFTKKYLLNLKYHFLVHHHRHGQLKIIEKLRLYDPKTIWENVTFPFGSIIELL